MREGKIGTVRRWWKDWRADVSGLAAIEFAMIAGFLSIAVLNVTDIAEFYFDKLQVDNATQMGAQAAWAACDLNHVPATVRCSSFSAAVSRAVHSTSLGSAVSLQSGSPSEGYYCVNSSGVLQYMSDVNSAPVDCSAAGVSSTTPADYVKIQTSYTYTPIFGGISIAAALPTSITSISWVRLGG
jgi:Flp pilus assembly protein TadG